MFRVEFLVDDKNLSAVLHALAGLVRDLSVPVPVAGTAPTLSNGQGPRKPRGAPRGDGADLLVATLRKRKITQIKGSEIRVLVKEIGLNPSGYSHFINNARDRGYLVKGGKVPSGPGSFWKLTNKPLAGDK